MLSIKDDSISSFPTLSPIYSRLASVQPLQPETALIQVTNNHLIAQFDYTLKSLLILSVVFEPVGSLSPLHCFCVALPPNLLLPSWLLLLWLLYWPPFLYSSLKYSYSPRFQPPPSSFSLYMFSWIDISTLVAFIATSQWWLFISSPDLSSEFQTSNW